MECYLFLIIGSVFHTTMEYSILKSGNKQMRIWVDIDWSRFGKNEKGNGSIIFTAGGKQIVLTFRQQK